MSAIRIIPVADRHALREFILFPFRLYRHDPLWVPPLIRERFRHFSPQHNPFYDHAEVQLFTAEREGEVVGTIAAIDDALHPQVWNEPVGFFGEFECVEDYDVARALFDAARGWLAGRGREIMRGPMNLHINDECGLLVEGRDGPPVVMMTYNPPYYPNYYERYGLRKVKDLLAYHLDIASYGPNLEYLPEQISRVARIARERYGVRIRKANLRRLHDELELVKPIHRQAWAQNWGALPMSDREFEHLAHVLHHMIDPDLTYLAFIDDQPIGCLITLPDHNQVVKHLNGRLWPLGWAKYLWYRRRVTGLRLIIMGVLAEHRIKGVESLFYAEGAKVALSKGYRWLEMSWILEDNYRVSRSIEAMGGRPYRRYRLYDLAVDGGGASPPP